jgi:predicted RNA-binding Zn-ribbon protein involved in translation (DUF1610 family)
LKQSEGEALVICPVCGNVFYTKVPDVTDDCYWFTCPDCGFTWFTWRECC